MFANLFLQKKSYLEGASRGWQSHDEYYTIEQRHILHESVGFVQGNGELISFSIDPRG